MLRFNTLLFGCLLLLLGTACQTAKHLEEEEVLYRNAEIQFEGKPPAVSKLTLENSFRQQPNARFLGLVPLRLNIYLRNRDKEKGFGRWKREKLGEPPVFYDEKLAETSLLGLQKKLIDEGYLQAEGHYDTLRESSFEVSVIYTLKAGNRYSIDSLDWPSDTTALGRMVNRNAAATDIQRGRHYQTSRLSRERQRLADIAGEEGFYGITAGTFYYFLDTAGAGHNIDLYLRLAEAGDTLNYKPHYIGRTTIYSNYLLEEQNRLSKQDTLLVDNKTFIQPQPFVRPDVIEDMVLQQEGELYRQSLQQKSINRLLSLGTYKFVNQRYKRTIRGDSVFLDRTYYLSPALTQDFSAELEASSLTSSTNSLGAGLNINYTHQNIFGGAERFDARFSSGIETQLGSGLAFVNTLNFLVETRLSLPTLRVPFGLVSVDNSWQSRTTALLNGSFQRRTNAFTIASVRTQFGYQWQPNQLQQHQWYPLQLNWVNLIDATSSFEQTIAQNPRLRESFSDYLITGTTYQYNYSENKPGQRSDYFSISNKIEPAGNLLFLGYQLFGSGEEEPYDLFGLPFAQFFRMETDARYHIFARKTDLISRVNIGFAIPYGNSNTVPFIRQFFVGGSNSIRAWQIRTLGPGASDAGLEDTSIYNDQTGDIKLETNLEYRFPIISFLKSAVFVDAGNIWLYLSENAEPVEGIFEWNNFISEIAVGAGTGLRLDLTFFVLRLDAAIPLRKPYLPKGSRWTFNEEGFGTGPWLNQNITYNLAIGYPF
jgi:outer membrane protein assembly factor BamA